MAGEAILSDLKQHKSDLSSIVEKEYPDYNLKIKRSNITADVIIYKVFFLTDTTETSEGFIKIILNNKKPASGSFNIGGVLGSLIF